MPATRSAWATPSRRIPIRWSGWGWGCCSPTARARAPTPPPCRAIRPARWPTANRGYRTAQLQHQKAQDARQAAQFGAQQARQAREDAYRREQDTLNRDLQERQFARTGESSFAKIARDLDLKPGTPEYADQARKYVQSQIEGEWESKDIIDPGDPDGERKITVQQNKRTGQYRRPELPGPTPPPPNLIRSRPTAASRSTALARAALVPHRKRGRLPRHCQRRQPEASPCLAARW